MEWKFVKIEKEKRGILNDIDTIDYLGMKNDRISIVPYAISVGMYMPKAISSRDNLLRPEYVMKNPRILAIFVVAKIGSLDSYENLEEDLNVDSINEYAEMCLNNGLEVIEHSIKNEPVENFRLLKIQELDDAYAKAGIE